MQNQQQNSISMLRSLSMDQSTNKNLIEFRKMYENLQQQQLQQKNSSSLLIPVSSSSSSSSSQLASSSGCSTASSLSINSLNSQFNKISFQQQSNESTQIVKVVDRKKLFVSNLPTNTKLCELFDLFRKYGSINEKLSVVKDQNYAFIHFYNESDAKIALKDVNDSLFKNRYIRVQFSTSQAHIKKSRTFDTAVGLLKEAKIIQPTLYPQQQKESSNFRPITSGNKCLSTIEQNQLLIQQQQELIKQYFEIRRLLAFNNDRNSYLALIQQPFIFPSIVKSKTFASFHN
jgi:RNA recognition motif-containing protein